jgi:hypothetical protein
MPQTPGKVPAAAADATVSAVGCPALPPVKRERNGARGNMTEAAFYEESSILAKQVARVLLSITRFGAAARGALLQTNMNTTARRNSFTQSITTAGFLLFLQIGTR